MFDLEYQKNPRILLAPKFEEYRERIENLLSPIGLEDHYVILSSGTTSGDLKGYALSRKALISNANAVNNLYGITPHDKWAISLPPYHVGGLSVMVRAALLGNEVMNFGPWDAKKWTQNVFDNKISFSTIVPTQLYDLIHHNCHPPVSLRALIVGGDFLSDSLESIAIEKGWPIFRTFGMTEVCSQLASSRILGSKELEILPIHQVKTLDQRLLVKSEALFTLQFVLKEKPLIQWAKEFCDEDGYFQTQDRAEIQDGTLRPLGRLDDQVKISGRLYHLLALKNSLEKAAIATGNYQKVELQLENDERKGKKIVLYHLKGVHKLDQVIEALELKPDEVVEVLSFERTDLGKLKKGR